MNKLLHSLILSLAILVGSAVHAQVSIGEPQVPEPAAGAWSAQWLTERDALGLPGLRPRLTMAIPLQAGNALDGEPSGPFSWSLEAWQLNTASLAHIQCHRLTPTTDSFLAEDCRFVDQPVPEHAVNLMQVRGEWTAAPGLSVGVGAFSLQSEPSLRGNGLRLLSDVGYPPGSSPMMTQPAEGLDLSVSFGIAHERVGDFLVGLQMARYRQRLSMFDLYPGRPLELLGLQPGEFERYGSSAQLALGWRRGSFSGDLLASARDVPLYLGSGHYTQAPLNSFDLEFSWRAVRNASISIGVSNVLDAAPRAAEDAGLEAGIEDPLEHIFGRIPYVRYKHDL